MFVHNGTHLLNIDSVIRYFENNIFFSIREMIYIKSCLYNICMRWHIQMICISTNKTDSFYTWDCSICGTVEPVSNGNSGMQRKTVPAHVNILYIYSNVLGFEIFELSKTIYWVNKIILIYVQSGEKYLTWKYIYFSYKHIILCTDIFILWFQIIYSE